MTEGELRRTALVIPPKGRAVLSIWAAAVGLFLAPFAFWQGIAAGVVFCLLWAGLVALLRARAVTGIQQLRSPLLRLAGVTVLVISAPGARVLVPAVPAAQAAALAYALAEDAPCR